LSRCTGVMTWGGAHGRTVVAPSGVRWQLAAPGSRLECGSCSVLVFDSVECAVDGLLPVVVFPFTLGGLHVGCPLGGLVPVGTQRVHVRPVTDGESGGAGGPQAGGLG